MNELVSARCAESLEQSQKLHSLLARSAAKNRRHQFARCAIDLACEHHYAHAHLIGIGAHGSAAALLRPLLEASTAAAWLLYKASCDFIMELPTNADIENSPNDLPQLRQMAHDLTPVFPAIETLLLALKPGGAAKWLHKYTHGGTPQLVRRTTNHAWSEPEIMLGLLRADLLCVIAGAAETAIEENKSLAAYVFSRRDNLGRELSARFGVPALPPQPKMWPAPDTAHCGDPF